MLRKEDITTVDFMTARWWRANKMGGISFKTRTFESENIRTDGESVDVEKPETSV